MLRRSSPGGVNKRRQTKGGNEVTSAALWADEKDWLVEVVIVEEGDEGHESLDYVGRLDLNALAERLLDFQCYWETTARPFEWKFTRQDLGEFLSKLSTPN
jgi:hypothetical protein